MALLTRRSLTTLITRTLISSPSSSTPLRYGFALAILNQNFIPESRKIPTRFKTSGSGYSPLNDPSPNWSNRPPKETILLDGCDYEHWLIVMEFPSNPNPSEDEMVQSYVNTLSSVLGSEEEAQKKIYSVCTTTYTGFGALISEELSHKVKVLPGVIWVLPDSYLDVPNKDYGGDLFEDGKVIRRPQYHYDQRQPNGHRPRPRYDRRRETMQNQRREPMQRGNFGQEQQGPSSEPTAMPGQNSSNSGPRVPYSYQGPAAQYPNQGPAAQFPNQGPAAQYPNQAPGSQYANQGPASEPAATGGQNSFNTGEKVPYPNHGDYSRSGD